jgi:ethanolamine ammonia-lyase small subunit
MKDLRGFTMARVGLGRAGDALPTGVLLELRRARAVAGDAVHETLNVAGLGADCEERGWPWVAVRSGARDRAQYLRRPDLGRMLDEESRTVLSAVPRLPGPFDLCIIVADGLSALAIHRHALAVLDGLMPKLGEAGWTMAPPVLVEQGRVAIGDSIATLLGARLSLVLIGERPGLSSPDSLGAYLTWSPAPGKTDAERNCISNIRPGGLAYGQAADRLFALMTESRRRELSGVALKEDYGRLLL